MIKSILFLVLATLVPFTAQAREHSFTVGDKVHIDVANEPEFSADATVRQDGRIAVPHCGDVQVAGLTTTQAQDAVAAKLKEFIRNPTVTIAVLDMSSNKAFLTGGGTKAATVDIAQHGTLLNILTNLGDISAVDLRAASVVRDGKEIKKDFHDLVVNADIAQDIPIIGGDTIVLPPAPSKRGVYVVGAVNTPKLVTYREGMTLLEAILEAGGFSKFASPDKTRIVRHQADGKEQIIAIKGKRLVRDGDLKQNVVLLGGDLVIVEEGFF